MTSVVGSDKRPPGSLRILGWGVAGSFAAAVAACHALNVVVSASFDILVGGVFLVLPLGFGALVASAAESELPLAPRIGLGFGAAVVSLASALLGALVYVVMLAAA